jgi:tetratricopeptide (TPR) repeat protein
MANFQEESSNAEQLISLLENTYWNLRKEFPDQDEHFYLARTLFMPFAERAKIGQNPLDYIIKVWKIEIPDYFVETWKTHWEGFTTYFSYAETKIFSVLNPPDSIKALCYFALHKEFLKESYRYNKEFHEIMFPILKMTSNDFSKLYKGKNPDSYKKEAESDIAFLKQTININPDDVDALFKLGIAYDKLEMYKEAVETYKITINLNPQFAEAYLNLGYDLGKLEMYRESVDPFKKAIEIRPSFIEAYLNLGDAYSKLEMYEKAIEIFKETIKLKPDKAEAYNKLGITYLSLDKFREASMSYKQALKLRPDYVNVHFNLGVSLLFLGQRDEAFEEYEILKKLDSEIAELLIATIKKIDIINNSKNI